MKRANMIRTMVLSALLLFSLLLLAVGCTAGTDPGETTAAAETGTKAAEDVSTDEPVSGEKPADSTETEADGSGEEATSGEEVSDPDETTGETGPIAEPAEPITLYEDGKTAYAILRGDKASQAVITAASALRTAFIDNLDITIDLCDEYMFDYNKYTLAIVVGTVSDEISTRLKSEFNFDDYAIHVEDQNLYLVGGSDAATTNAVNYFIDKILKANPEKLILDGDLDMRYTKKYAIDTMTIDGADLSEYRIVYDADLYYSKLRAAELQTFIIEQCGKELPLVPDTEAAVEKEILVGAVERDESRAIAATFDLPNVYYAASVVNGKLVIVNEGVRTGEAVMAALQETLKTVGAASGDLNADTCSISGDVKKATDKRALDRPEGTDIRVLHSNVLGFTSEGNDNGYSDQQRAELLADTVLIYYPDVLTLNEMNPGWNMTAYVMKFLNAHYTFIDNADYLGLYEDIEGESANTKNRKYSFPIAYRKDAGLTELGSGFSYLSDMLYFHGASWTAFEMADGNRFLAVSAHLSQNTDAAGKIITTWSENVLEIVEEAYKEFGYLPVVMNGDWFFAQKSYAAAYDYIIASGYVDGSETALKKHSDGVGTFHTIGVGEQGRIEEDLIFIRPEWFEMLAHKILIDFYTINASDHYLVLGDLRFVKSAKAADIEPYDDGVEQLEIVEEGPGGIGTWPVN